MFELAFEGCVRAKSMFYDLCEDKYYLFLLSIVSLQPCTEPGREIGGAREILAEWVSEEWG